MVNSCRFLMKNILKFKVASLLGCWCEHVIDAFEFLVNSIDATNESCKDGLWCPLSPYSVAQLQIVSLRQKTQSGKRLNSKEKAEKWTWSRECKNLVANWIESSPKVVNNGFVSFQKKWWICFWVFLLYRQETFWPLNLGNELLPKGANGNGLTIRAITKTF